MSHICIKPIKNNSTVNHMEDFLNSFFGQRQHNHNYYNFPVYHVEEQEKNYQLIIELAGYEADSIDVKVDKDNLVVEHQVQNKENNKPRQREFTRQFTIPKDVNQEQISAHFKNGLLEIELPKKEEAAPLKIKIN